MSCSDIALPLAYDDCQPIVPTQSMLRHYYGLPANAYDISVNYNPPKEVKLPLSVFKHPGFSVLRWCTPGHEHFKRIE